MMFRQSQQHPQQLQQHGYPQQQQQQQQQQPPPFSYGYANPQVGNHGVGSHHNTSPQQQQQMYTAYGPAGNAAPPQQQHHMAVGGNPSLSGGYGGFQPMPAAVAKNLPFFSQQQQQQQMPPPSMSSGSNNNLSSANTPATAMQLPYGGGGGGGHSAQQHQRQHACRGGYDGIQGGGGGPDFTGQQAQQLNMMRPYPPPPPPQSLLSQQSLMGAYGGGGFGPATVSVGGGSVPPANAFALAAAAATGPAPAWGNSWQGDNSNNNVSSNSNSNSNSNNINIISSSGNGSINTGGRHPRRFSQGGYHTRYDGRCLPGCRRYSGGRPGNNSQSGVGGGGGRPVRRVHNSYYYNQQHQYSSNNAVPEKTPTLRIVHPTTNAVISIKVNRIYSTMADLREQLQQPTPTITSATAKDAVEKAGEVEAERETAGGSDSPNLEATAEVSQTTMAGVKAVATDGAVVSVAATTTTAETITPPPTAATECSKRKPMLCLDFLSLRGCFRGSGCDKVHIAGLEYVWESIEAATEVRVIKVKRVDDTEGEPAAAMDEEMYKSGFRVHCYDPTLTKYYDIPSEYIIKTAGSDKYIAMFNEHGNNFKAKFRLCPTLIAEGKCPHGSQCEDVHCVLGNLGELEESHSQRTHVNSDEAMEGVPRLPAEMMVRVFEPNSADTFKDYVGSYVLITEGAKTYQRCYEQENNTIPHRKRMQHCAHFRLKEMCRQGETCRFLHVLPTPEEVEAKKTKEVASPAAPAPVVTTEAAVSAAKSDEGEVKDEGKDEPTASAKETKSE